MIMKVMGAFLAVCSFSILLEIPKRLVLFSGLTGGVGWFLYLYMEKRFSSVILVAFVSAVAVALLSNIFARLLKAPASVFLVAGILPSVPGGSIYRSVYFLIANDLEKSEYYFLETLQIAGAIAMAIFITDSIIKLYTKLKNRYA